MAQWHNGQAIQCFYERWSWSWQFGYFSVSVIPTSVSVSVFENTAVSVRYRYYRARPSTQPSPREFFFNFQVKMQVLCIIIAKNEPCGQKLRRGWKLSRQVQFASCFWTRVWVATGCTGILYIHFDTRQIFKCTLCPDRSYGVFK